MTRNAKKKAGIRLPGLDSTIYYARITRQEDGYLVEFPDLPGCLTEGATREDALQNAREALSGWLFVALKNGQEFTMPSPHRGRNFHPIAPDIDVAIPLIFLWARKLLNLTQGDVAEKIGVSQQAYRKLEIPGKSNPTLKTYGVTIWLATCNNLIEQS
jgi:antitoxin HicB